MKKILIIAILILLFTSSCDERFNIEKTTYIDSIGIDYQNNEYHVYYHISSNITNNQNVSYSIGVSKASNLYQAIHELSMSVVGNISLTHVQSIILTSSFATRVNLEMLLDLIKTYDYITPNFYFFYTTKKISEIFSVENPENVSPFFSIINSSDYYTTYKLSYFSEVACAIYEPYKTIKITVIDIYYIWTNEQKKINSVIPVGVAFIGDESLIITKNYAIDILNHEYSSIVIYNDIKYNIYNQSIKIKYLNNNSFRIIFKGNLYASNINAFNHKKIIEEFNKSLENDLIKLFNDTKNKQIDLFELRNLAYRYKYQDFDFNTTQVSFEFNYKLLN